MTWWWSRTTACSPSSASSTTPTLSQSWWVKRVWGRQANARPIVLPAPLPRAPLLKTARPHAHPPWLSSRRLGQLAGVPLRLCALFSVIVTPFLSAAPQKCAFPSASCPAWLRLPRFCRLPLLHLCRYSFVHGWIPTSACGQIQSCWESSVSSLKQFTLSYFNRFDICFSPRLK